MSNRTEVKLNSAEYLGFRNLLTVSGNCNPPKMEEYRFTLVRDYDTKPYNWETWENGKVVKSEQSDILAFYKVYLNDNMKTSFGFEIRKDEAGTEIFDHDDTLSEFLYLQGKNIKEVNDFCGQIFDAMYQDFYGKPLEGTFR